MVALYIIDHFISFIRIIVILITIIIIIIIIENVLAKYSSYKFICRVNPIYFVFFTTATIIASAIMYRGWHTANPVNTASLICGFIIIFIGVYLLDSVARKTKESAPIPIPPVASASSLHRHDSKSNLSQQTTSIIMMDTETKQHVFMNSKRIDHCESSLSKVSCRRTRRAFSV